MSRGLFVFYFLRIIFTQLFRAREGCSDGNCYYLASAVLKDPESRAKLGA